MLMHTNYTNKMVDASAKKLIRIISINLYISIALGLQ